MISRFFSVLALCTLAALPSCTPSTVSLDYMPSVARNQRGPAVFSVGSFRDERGVASNFLGGIGLPGIVNLENIYLKVPVEESVRNAFLHAMDARHMLARSSSKYSISGVISDLHCEMLKNPYASVTMQVSVTDVRGRVIHSKEYTAERQSVFYVHASGDPVPVLRNLTSRALQDAVDHAIDDPEMRAAMSDR